MIACTRYGRAATGVALCLLASALPSAVAWSADDEGAFDRVTVDLSGRRFARTLPFDIPFVITGRVPAGTRSVRVSYRERASLSRGATTLTEILPAWSPIAGIDTVNVSFNVQVPRLEPESYYDFTFELERVLSGKELRAFKGRIERAIDSRFRSLASGTLTEDAAAALRTTLIADLAAVTGPDWKLVSKPAILDASVPAAQVVNAFSVYTVPISTWQARLRGHRRDYVTQSNTLFEALNGLLGNADLRTLLDGLEGVAVSGGNKPFAQIWDSQSDLVALMQSDDRAQRVLSRALDDATGGVETPDKTWSPAALEPVIAGYQATIERLGEMRAFLRRLSAPKGPYRQYTDALITDGRISKAAATRLLALTEDGGAIWLAQNQVANAREMAIDIRKSLLERADQVSKAAEGVGDVIRSRVLVAGTTIDGTATPHHNYASADAGLFWAPDIGVVPYAGVNIYLRPINKKVPLSQAPGHWKKRFAITVALTLRSVADSNPKTRENLFGSQALVIGVGWRVTDAMRLGVGGVVFRREDPNPFVVDFDGSDNLAARPYLSFSFDYDLIKTFKGIGDVFK